MCFAEILSYVLMAGDLSSNCIKRGVRMLYVYSTAVSCAASSMDYGLAVSLKSWRYQRGRNEQRHLNCVFVA